MPLSLRKVRRFVGRETPACQRVSLLTNADATQEALALQSLYGRVSICLIGLGQAHWLAEQFHVIEQGSLLG